MSLTARNKTASCSDTDTDTPVSCSTNAAYSTKPATPLALSPSTFSDTGEISSGYHSSSSGNDCAAGVALESSTLPYSSPSAYSSSTTLAGSFSGLVGPTTPDGSGAEGAQAFATTSDTLCLPGPEIPDDELEILAKMEQQNRLIEQDTRSVSGSTKKSDSDPDSTSEVSESVQNQQSLSEDLQEDLWLMWSNIVQNWDQEYKKKPQYVQELAMRGIPSHFRTIAWQLLSGADVKAVHDQYVEYMRIQSPHEKVIQRDISRTYPEHEFFRDNEGRGQQSLFNVMKAYSIRDKEVGYCQGSAFIAGLLLLQMPEEEAFAVLLCLMNEFGLRELYKPQMTQLGLCMFQLESLVQELMPDLHTHFQNMGLDSSMYSSSWFLTLFSTQLPLELVNRIMDLFLCEGMEAIFRIGLAILQLCRYELLTLDMEGMLKFFQRELAQKFDNDHELLMTTAYQVKYNAKKMKRLEKDYHAKRTKEQEEAVELRRLRTENRLLRQRIDYLEQESAALADRLLKGQVNLALEAESSLSVKHEMLSLRELNSEAHRRLEEAYETIRELSNKAREHVTDAEAQVDDRDMIDLIHHLQQELIQAKTRDADNEITIRDYRMRINELETANKRLREVAPDHTTAALQEELVSVKMREAEATLSLKEMRQKLIELEQQWQAYQAFYESTLSQNGSVNNENAKKSRLSIIGVSSLTPMSPSVRDLQDQLMIIRIKEADAVAELKETRQKVMELETQVHVSSNQICRQDKDFKLLQLEFEAAVGREKESLNSFKEEQQKVKRLDLQHQEQSVLGRLKETELLETIAELRTRLSDLESKNYERWTQDQLNKSCVDDSGHDSKQRFDADTIGSPTSLTNSIHSADGFSLSSEFDLNACVAEMTMKAPSIDGISISSNSFLLSAGQSTTLKATLSTGATGGSTTTNSEDAAPFTLAAPPQPPARNTQDSSFIAAVAGSGEQQ